MKMKKEMKDYVVIVEKRIITKADSPVKAINEIMENYKNQGFSFRAVERRIDINDSNE